MCPDVLCQALTSGAPPYQGRESLAVWVLRCWGQGSVTATGLLSSSLSICTHLSTPYIRLWHWNFTLDAPTLLQLWSQSLYQYICSCSSFLILIFFFFFFKLYITVLVLPNIKMNPPQVYMCSPSWTFLSTCLQLPWMSAASLVSLQVWPRSARSVCFPRKRAWFSAILPTFPRQGIPLC